MDGENTRFGNLHRIERVCQPGKYRIVGFDHYWGRIISVFSLYPLYLVFIESKFAAEPVDDSTGFLPLGALNMATCPNCIQTAYIRYGGIVRCSCVQCSLEIGQVVTG